MQKFKTLITCTVICSMMLWTIGTPFTFFNKEARAAGGVTATYLSENNMDVMISNINTMTAVASFDIYNDSSGWLHRHNML